MNGHGATNGSTGSTKAKDTSTLGRGVCGLQGLWKLSMEELRGAFKAFIESVENGLQSNEDAFADFKDVPTRYN